jgi:hypothetical protein
VVEPAKNQLLRDFRRRSIFDFFNTICQQATSNKGGSLLLAVADKVLQPTITRCS